MNYEIQLTNLLKETFKKQKCLPWQEYEAIEEKV